MVSAFSVGLYGDTWYNNYENGKAAVEKKNWSEAIEYLRVALDDKNEPRLNAKTYGLRFVDYLPYYYLGKAYYGNALYKDAQTALERSLEYGAVKKTDLYDSLKEMLADCKEKLKPPPPKLEPPVSREKEQKKEAEKSKTEIVSEPVKAEEKSQPPDLPQTRPEKKQEAPAGEEKTVPEDKRLVGAVGNLNRGIRYYFEGNRTGSEGYLRESLRVFSGESKYAKELVTTYQFLAVVLIEAHYLDGDPSGRLLQEAEKYINEIKTMSPGFRLDDAYFSPKIIKIFSR